MFFCAFTFALIVSAVSHASKVECSYIYRLCERTLIARLCTPFVPFGSLKHHLLYVKYEGFSTRSCTVLFWLPHYIQDISIKLRITKTFPLQSPVHSCSPVQTCHLNFALPLLQ